MAHDSLDKEFEAMHMAKVESEEFVRLAGLVSEVLTTPESEPREVLEILYDDLQRGAVPA